MPPECDEIRRCLDEALPDSVKASDLHTVHHGTMSCLGGTKRAAWDNRRCLPYEFGRHADTGRTLQVVVACDDLCPDQAFVTVTFAKVSQFECECLKGTPQHTSGWGGYVGCTPMPSSPGASFRVEERRGEVSVLAGMGMSMEHLGFYQGDAVDSIDGVPVREPEDVTRIFGRLPRHVPGSILMHRTDARPPIAGDARFTTELHYIGEAEADQLARLADRLQLTAIKAGTTSCFPFVGPAMITVGAWSAVYDPECSDHAMRRVSVMEEAIRGAAQRAKPRSPPERPPIRDCKALESKPKVFTLSRGRHALDVRYVDWVELRLPERTAEAARTLEGEKIRRVLEERHSATRAACWGKNGEMARRAPGAPTGAGISVALTIDPSGRVTNAVAQHKAPLFPGLAECLEESLRTYQFPKSGGTTTATPRFVFREDPSVPSVPSVPR